MTSHAAPRLFLFSLLGLLLPLPAIAAQTPAAPSANRGATLEMVVILTRHGVRSPLTPQADLDRFSAAPWPQWDVAPGILTAHGYQLMKLFGAWDRIKFSGEGLLAPTGCADAAHVTILADTDERTRSTGKALAEGMFPGCAIAVHSEPDGKVDPLFNPLHAGIAHPDAALDTAAVGGRIGGDMNSLTQVYRPQLAALDRVLSGCGHLPANPHRTSIFDIPASLKPGSGNSLFSAHGPVVTAGTLAENLLLEYTQGMSDADTGWGCLDEDTLRELMQIDRARWDFSLRAPAIARMVASNLLEHIRRTLEQRANGKPVSGVLGKRGDRLVILVGHDSNIAAIAGALGLNWAFDGRADDTPPGGALVFELWRPLTGEPFVRLFYTAQTLDQMRKAEPLTPANPPAEAPLFIPGCSRADLSCSWTAFSAAARQAADPAWVSKQPYALYSGFGNGVSAFPALKSSRPQGATTRKTALTGHSISETAP